MKKVIATLTIATALIAGFATLLTSMNQQTTKTVQLADPGRGA
jgi:hypothetical protein